MYGFSGEVQKFSGEVQNDLPSPQNPALTRLTPPQNPLDLTSPQNPALTRLTPLKIQP
jgi:hypothetical protein